MSSKNRSKQKGSLSSRREFLRGTTMAATGFFIVPRHVLGRGFLAPSDRLTIAAIGAGGKGGDDLRHFYGSGKVDVAYLCDVDDRQAAASRQKYDKAKYYKDFREMLDKEHKHFDAVSVSVPDNVHAVAAMGAIQLGKHVYVQKPMTHDIYEARMLTEAVKRYKVVAQMGNQGSSEDGVRLMQEWYNAGLIGDATAVHIWTNRPVWPQGGGTPTSTDPVPAELNWDLWQGPAVATDYHKEYLPFNWRGWWDYGTGALGDMGCHLIEAPFRVLGLGYPTQAECSVGSTYVGEFQRGYFPDGPPPSSHIVLKFKGKEGKPDIDFNWMDGGIQPERPDELGPNDMMGDGGNGAILVGTKGKMMCSTYGRNPKLLPASLTKDVPQTVPRVKGGEDGHYAQWIAAAKAGPGSKEASEISSPFSIAGPLTETVLMGNLAIRSFDIRKPKASGKGFDYPGRYMTLLWDGENMKITNFDDANQFVKREYRSGWHVLSV